MGCKTIPEQLASALGKSDVATSDQLPIVENNTLYRTTVGDLATSLGLTGAITGLNDGNATPLLTGTAPNYQIRGVLGAQGVVTSVNPNGSVTVAGQFNDAGNTRDGAGIVQNRTADTILFRRIKAGIGINVTQEDNNILIDNSQVAVSNNTVIVSELSDFPDPVSGVITLDSSTNYFVANNISTTNRFVFGANTVLSASNPFVTQLTYTGTGNMFTFANGSTSITDIAVSCPNGTLLDTTGVTVGNLVIRFVRFNTINNLGSLHSPSVGISNVFMVNHTGQGFTFGSVTNRRFSLQTFTVANSTDATSAFLDLGTATFSAFTVTNLAFLNTTSGQVFLKGAAAGVNLLEGIIGFVSKVTINGDMVGLDTITNGDPNWDFTDCNKIGDTRPLALMTMDAPATTVIAAANTPVVVNGTFTDRGSSLFTINTAGRATYTGVRAKSADLTASITFSSASGTNTYTFYVAKNSAIIAASGISREVSAASNANISLIWDLPIAQDDFIEIWVENNDNSNDVDAVKIVARIK